MQPWAAQGLPVRPGTGCDVVTEFVGTAVLKDYPLRLWAASRQHTDELLREFTLLLEGERTGQTDLGVPKSLVDLATLFTSRFGPLLDELAAKREAALREGADRMDSVVPIPAGSVELLDQVARVLNAVDEYCRNGDLLALERSEESRRLLQWSSDEILAQLDGAEPTPWPGPF